MTASEILNIAITVAVCQAGMELIAHYMVFKGEAYQRAVDALGRAKWRLDKAEADAKKNPKHEKKYERAKDDYSAAKFNVSRSHNTPRIWSSIFFALLLKILGTEHGGKVIGVLPFAPMKLLQRVTRRGLTDTIPYGFTLLEDSTLYIQQGASYLFVYLLATMSVKFYVTQLLTKKPPQGADGGFMAILDTPQGKSMMKSFGVNPEDLKYD